MRDIAAARTTESDRLLEASTGFALPGLATTTMMAHGAHVARADGRLSFDRLERGVLPQPAEWIPPGLKAADFSATLVGARLESPTCWPFRQDTPVGDFAATDGPKWWTHGQVHALIGGAYWPEMSEWELMHMARLSEAVASWHWYWLSELDRRYCPLHTVMSADRTPDCDACRALEASAGDPAIRRTRLLEPEAQATADNGVAFLRYEGHCYDAGLTRGTLIVPEGPYLSMGEACDYARAHRARLLSPAHQRWVSTCLRPGIDFATSVAGFSAKAAQVAEALITPMTAPTDVNAERARRVLQDVGARVCHAAAIVGDATRGFSGAMDAIQEALAGLGQGTDAPRADQLLGIALQSVASDLQSTPELSKLVCALGYAPTQATEHEPDAFRSARGAALLARAKAVGSPLFHLLAARPSLREAITAMPRSGSLLQDTARAAEARAPKGADDSLVAAFTGWLTLAAQHWGPEDATPHVKGQWYYRLALTELPGEDSWGQLRLRPNPYLTTLPCPFSVPWLEALLSGAAETLSASTPRPAKGLGYAVMGQGRARPILLAWTPEREALLNRLQHTPTIRQLIVDGVTREAITAALDEELVIALHQHHSATLEVDAVEDVSPAEDDVPLGNQTEEAGPWQDATQARYYDAYCQRSDLYQDLARALVARAEIEPGHRVADLGCGTGVSTSVALTKLGPEGHLLALDPAPRMVALAEAHVSDPRVRYEVGTARRMLQVGGPLDRVLCSSAIWLDPNILVPWKAAQLLLQPGGRLCFSIPSEYLGHDAHWMTETGTMVATAIQSAREQVSGESNRDAVLTPTPHPDYLGDITRMREILLEIGYSAVEATLYQRAWRVSDYLDWMSQPVSLATICPGDNATQEAFLTAVADRVDLHAEFETRWFLVVAKQ